MFANEEAYEEGRKEVYGLLRRIFLRRVGRPLTIEEPRALGPEQVEDRALSLEGEALAAWLLAPNAK